jgi:hypothetical protein
LQGRLLKKTMDKNWCFRVAPLNKLSERVYPHGE